jgi:glycosyltransferase involved in cell wall biosynthesis
VVDGVTGLLVEDTQEAFSAALAGLLADDERRLALGGAAATHAARFTWDQTVAGVSTVLAAAAGVADVRPIADDTVAAGDSVHATRAA